VAPAPAAPAHCPGLPRLQSLPAWEWARVAIAAAWLQRRPRAPHQLRAYAEALALRPEFADVLRDASRQ